MATVDQSVRRGDKDRRLYTWAAALFTVIVLTGFARTYYLKGVFGAPALSGLVHMHGIVMTAWVTLFVVQVRLIAAHRIGLHRRLGVIGALLAAVVIVVGVTTAIAGARREASSGPPALVFLSVPLVDILSFAVLVGTALYFRRRGDIHKRLMLLSCSAFLTAAISRIPLGFIQTGHILLLFGLTDLCLLVFVVYDTVKRRRLHPAFGWGLSLIVASQPLRLMLAGTQAWMKFATWLVG